MSLPKIYGLVGYPVKHSFSPAIQKVAFAYHNIPAEYRFFEVAPQDLEKFLLEDIVVKDILGFNITIPHKIRAREILEKKYPLNIGKYPEEDLYYVKLSGAINTVKRNGTQLEYYNTDASGFLRSLEKGDLKFETEDKTVLIIGCGGAGRAVIAALSWKQHKIKRIYVNDIKEEALNSAQAHFSKLPQWAYLEDVLKFIPVDGIPKVIEDCQLLVNASPVGMQAGDPSVVDKSQLHSNLFVYDLVYHRKTQLVKDAQSHGLKAVDGSGMLLYQGVDAFKIWTQKKAPIDIMKGALKKELEKCQK